jgi:hypothetical protein
MGRTVKEEGCVIEFVDVSVAEFRRQIREDGGTLREKYVEKEKRWEIAPMKGGRMHFWFKECGSAMILVLGGMGKVRFISLRGMVPRDDE